jgi:hypothetical protein
LTDEEEEEEDGLDLCVVVVVAPFELRLVFAALYV